MVGSLHGNRDIGDPVVDPLISPLPEPVAVNNRTVRLIRHKVLDSVLADEPSQPFSHIQNLVFCKKIHQAITGRCSCQTYDALHLRPYLYKYLEPLRLPVFEG